MNDDNVITLPVTTTLDISPERVLDAALKADLDTVLVIGWDKSDRFYASGSTGDIGDLLLLLEVMKKELLSE